MFTQRAHTFRAASGVWQRRFRLGPISKPVRQAATRFLQSGTSSSRIGLPSRFLSPRLSMERSSEAARSLINLGYARCHTFAHISSISMHQVAAEGRCQACRLVSLACEMGVPHTEGLTTGTHFTTISGWCFWPPAPSRTDSRVPTYRRRLLDSRYRQDRIACLTSLSPLSLQHVACSMKHASLLPAQTHRVSTSRCRRWSLPRAVPHGRRRSVAAGKIQRRFQASAPQAAACCTDNGKHLCVLRR